MHKRVIWLALCILLILSMVPVASTFAAESDDVIRVKLTVGTPTSYSFFLDGNYSVEQDGSIPLERQLYTVKVEGSSLSLYLGNTRLYSGNTIGLLQHAPTPGLNNFTYLYNTRYETYLRYLGDLIFTISSSSIQVVNRLYLEEYLYGVVPHEMSNSWPLEALKAQAVVARSYAVKRIGSSGSYDIGDTSSDQVYKGYNASYTRAIQAVDDTAKKVLKYGGNIVTTYYSASNGGCTDIPLHNWSSGEDVPYYQLQVDTFDRDNPSSLYETVFFPTVIDASHPVAASANTSGTPNAANAVEYIKQMILESGQLSSLGVSSVDAFELTGVPDLETASSTPQPTEDTTEAGPTPQPPEDATEAESTPQPTEDATEAEPSTQPTEDATEAEPTPQPTESLSVNGLAVNTVPEDIIPPAASTLNAISIESSSSLGLSWSAVSGADGYKLWRCTQKSGTYTEVADTALTGYTDVGLTTGRTYYYKVCAYINSGTDKVCGGFSGIQSNAPEAPFELAGVTALAIDTETPDIDGEYNDRPTAYSEIQCSDYTGAIGTFTVSVKGTPATVSDIKLDLRYLDASNGDSTYKVFNNDSLRIFVVQAENRSGVNGFSISQKRYGHGIGLSQRGAQQRANAGHVYDDILSFYYPGTTLSTLSISKPVLTSKTWSSSANATVVSTTDYLNVRSGPATSYSIVGRLPGGARINVVQASVVPGWHMLNYGGTMAYVSSEYVDGQTFYINARVNDPTYGAVTGGGIYFEGTPVTLRAYPNDGYRFVRWQETGSKSAAYSFTVNNNLTATAEFAVIDTPYLTVATAGYDQIQLNWTEAERASGYEIYRSTKKSGTYTKIATVSSAALNYTDTGRTLNKTYYYKVRAYCSAKTKTTYGSFSVTQSGAATVVIPAAPLITATSASYNSNRISWGAVAGAHGYEVYRSTTKSGTYSRIVTTSATSCLHTGLTTGKTYYYKVRGFANAGTLKIYGDYSVIQSSAPMAVAPAIPAMIASPASYNSNRVSWGSVSGADGYEVYRSTTKSGTYSRIITTSATSCLHTGLTTGKTYYYKVRSFTNAGNVNVYSDFSVIQSAAPVPSVPESASSRLYSSTSIKTSWSPVIGASGYEVWRSDNGSNYVYTKTLTKAYYINTGLTAENSYQYIVRSFTLVNNVKIYGGFSTSNSVTIPAATTEIEEVATPSSIVSWRYSSTSIKSVWSPVPGAVGYEVFRSVSPVSGFTRQKTTASTYYINTGLATGTRYYYKVRAYSFVNGEKVFSAYSSSGSAIP